MRVLLWNTHGGPGKRRLEWLDSRSWDVAILLEVSATGRERLEALADGWVTSGPVGVTGSGRRYYATVVARPSVAFVGVLAPPSFTAADGYYQERVHAVTVHAAGEEWVIVATHMPNSVVRGGGKDHSRKERCYEELGSWLSDRDPGERLVLGMDCNRGDWRASVSPVKEHSRIAQQFVRHPEDFGLRDVYLDYHAPAERPTTYWTQTAEGLHGHYFDRIFVRSQVTVVSAPVIHHDVVMGATKLSDHAAVEVELQ